VSNLGIHRRIEEFLADHPHGGLPAAVRGHRFLPLYIGWLAALGICPDGTFVRWDEDTNAVTPLADGRLRRLAICEGAKKYPELRGLLPNRPPKAVDCDGPCAGTGQIAGLPNMICRCGGTGWLIPGEPEEAPT
jgi:hypothetical protein